MERLSEESLNPEQLAFEAERSKSLTIIARTIVDNARLVLDAQTRINDIPERKELPATNVERTKAIEIDLNNLDQAGQGPVNFTPEKGMDCLDNDGDTD